MLMRTFECTMCLVLWHDHGTILGLGCIIITVHIAYDQAVFFTQEEYEARYGKSPPIQSQVEQLVIHLILNGRTTSLTP